MDMNSIPKPVLYGAAAVLFAGIAFGMYKFAFGDRKKAEQAAANAPQENAMAAFPDGQTEEESTSKYDNFRENDREKNGGNDVMDYWNSLDNSGETSDGGLKVTGKGKDSDDGQHYNGEYLDPTIYSERDIELIKSGFMTKAQVDERIAKSKAREEKYRQDKLREEREKANEDSLYLAKMEKALQLAQKYSQAPDAANRQQQQQPEEPEEPEPRRIDVERTKIPSTTLVEDGIITSLEEDQPLHNAYSTSQKLGVPAKATFLKSEMLVSGQRVIMRLVQDLKLSDGTVIPSNTHISGTCEINKRLEIKVTTINYGGKIYYTDLSIFDNDGTEGIYCPVLPDKRARKGAKNVGRQASNAVGNILTGLTKSNPYVSTIAGSAVNEITKAIDQEGNTTVSVAAGYEFYVFEDLEKTEQNNY